MRNTKRILLAATAVVLGSAAAQATDLEVIHWWTSKGESAAVSQFAKAFDNDGQGDHWVDSAIALGQTARATIMQRILGGDPPGAAQFNPSREYEELIKNGQLLMLDDVAEANHWADVIKPQQFIDACRHLRHSRRRRAAVARAGRAGFQRTVADSGRDASGHAGRPGCARSRAYRQR